MKTLPKPRYWMDETSGVLRPAVERFFRGEELGEFDLGLWRAYLAQWMAGPWIGADELRERIATIKTTADLRSWLDAAEEMGIDPT